jgi:predicted nuclease with RNAse H fold
MAHDITHVCSVTAVTQQKHLLDDAVEISAMSCDQGVEVALALAQTAAEPASCTR